MTKQIATDLDVIHALDAWIDEMILDTRVEQQKVDEAHKAWDAVEGVDLSLAYAVAHLATQTRLSALKEARTQLRQLRATQAKHLKAGAGR